MIIILPFIPLVGEKINEIDDLVYEKWGYEIQD
jgi:hypothetical protein